MSQPKTNPKNDRIKREYLVWLKEAKQRSPSTVEQVRHAIDRLEAYTGYKDFATFNKDQAVAFKETLTATKAERTGKPVSLATVHHTLQAIKDFLSWLQGQPTYRRRIKPGDIAYLNLTMGEEREAHTATPKVYPPFEDFRAAILAMPAGTETERRDQALMAFLLSTGMRDAALAGLKLKHISIERSRVFQDPRDIKTKFRKAIETFFFPVGDDVLAIVHNWVAFLTDEKHFGPDDPLFPKTDVAPDDAGNFAPAGLSRTHWADAAPVRKIFREAFQRIGLAYASPHTVRNTLTQLAYQLRLTPEAFKVWSQNLGHDSPLTTLNSYGYVTPERQADILTGLRHPKTTAYAEDTMADRIAERLFNRLKQQTS
jgi:integrase